MWIAFIFESPCIYTNHHIVCMCAVYHHHCELSGVLCNCDYNPRISAHGKRHLFPFHFGLHHSTWHGTARHGTAVLLNFHHTHTHHSHSLTHSLTLTRLPIQAFVFVIVRHRNGRTIYVVRLKCFRSQL